MKFFLIRRFVHDDSEPCGCLPFSWFIIYAESSEESAGQMGQKGRQEKGPGSGFTKN